MIYGAGKGAEKKKYVLESAGKQWVYRLILDSRCDD